MLIRKQVVSFPDVSIACGTTRAECEKQIQRWSDSTSLELFRRVIETTETRFAVLLHMTITNTSTSLASFPVLSLVIIPI